MSNDTIKADELSSFLEDLFDNYTDNVRTIMEDAIDETVDSCIKALKNDPNIPVKTGKYKKSFYKAGTYKSYGRKRVIIGNKKYQLTHLLEDGHYVYQNSTYSRKFPHWEEAEARVNRDYLKNLQKGIEKL